MKRMILKWKIKREIIINIKNNNNIKNKNYNNNNNNIVLNIKRK